MNNIDRQYKELLEYILHFGVDKADRTGTGTKSIFGWQIRHNMKEGFPLLTTKKMAWKTMVTELLWFLRGDTNIKYLVDNGCHIWDGDAYKKYKTEIEKSIDDNAEFEDREDFKKFLVMSKEDFIDEIKTDDEFAKKWGELGPIYGKQWRQWQGWMNLPEVHSLAKGSLWYDQIGMLVHQLKTNPDSRRLMVSAWNVAELDQMALPPCHYGFQVYTRELSFNERHLLYCKSFENTNDTHKGSSDTDKMTEYHNNRNIPTRAISLMWNQRSCDVPLGIPMNIASYALLLTIIADEVNMIPDELIGNLGDCHIYLNQMDGVKEQITRTPYELPKLWINNLRSDTNTILGDITKWSHNDFKIENYQSHPKIYFPLSN
jgi:thymidylate synthase